MTFDKIKRQTEILCYAEDKYKDYSMMNLCDIFGVEAVTIHRDLSDLRSQGYKIHSTKHRVTLIHPLKLSDYNQLLSIYLPISNEAVGYPKNITLSTQKLQSKSLQVFVKLVRAIEDHLEISILYDKVTDNEVVRRTVQPYRLFPTLKDWRLIGKSDGTFKQFIVDNIKKIEESDFHFQPDSSFDLQEMFSDSWEVFRAENPAEVVLHFSRNAARFIEKRIWTENQILKPQKDGSLFLTLQIGDTDEICGWIMGWGNDVEVISPKRLREEIIKRAKGVIERNEK